MNPEDFHDEFKDFIHELIEGKNLEGATLGAAKLFVKEGEEALSVKQKYVFENYVVNPFVVKECKRCSHDIPWCEMYHALDNGGYCNYCWHMMQKIENQ